MAEMVFSEEAAVRGLSAQFSVDSAGTAAEVGSGIDRRARRALEKAGYHPREHRARQFEPAWLDERDLVVVMSRGHQRWMERHLARRASRARVGLLLSYLAGPAAPGGSLEIPDPWYGDEREFESCLALIRAGTDGLLDELTSELSTG
jgi:protein-tyrosine phosphatase